MGGIIPIHPLWARAMRDHGLWCFDFHFVCGCVGFGLIKVFTFNHLVMFSSFRVRKYQSNFKRCKYDHHLNSCGSSECSDVDDLDTSSVSVCGVACVVWGGGSVCGVRGCDVCYVWCEGVVVFVGWGGGGMMSILKLLSGYECLLMVIWSQ